MQEHPLSAYSDWPALLPSTALPSQLSSSLFFFLHHQHFVLRASRVLAFLGIIARARQRSFSRRALKLGGTLEACL